jgi:hypothetical protein
MNDQVPNWVEPEDALDALLRESDQYIPDDGFTARVLVSLSSCRRPWAHLVILTAAAVVASVLAVFWMPPLAELQAAVAKGISTGEWTYFVVPVLVLTAISSILWAELEILRQEIEV